MGWRLMLQMDAPEDRAHHGRFDISITAASLSVRHKSTGRWINLVKNVDMEIPAGSKVACLGNSGCGKTSLLRLLSGKYKPTNRGRITIGGIPSSEVALHRTIAYMDQVRLYTAVGLIGP